MSNSKENAASSEPAAPAVLDAGRSVGSDGICLVWKFESPLRSVSSSLVGGGLGEASWVLIATVDDDYGRFDPDLHLEEMASRLGLFEPGVAMMTAVDVAEFRTATIDGVVASATVGVGNAVWAAERATASSGVSPSTSSTPIRPGTINLVTRVPVALTDAALVNAVATVTEAKAQALFDRGIDGTGTASDAVCVLCAADGSAEPFGGPRSRWGSRVAQAAYLAVVAGIDGQIAKNRKYPLHL